jgi:hypothetical protein
MEVPLDPALTELFGSRTRLLTMAVLANAEAPMTGYRVAKVADLPRPKVYTEIRRAMKAGLVRFAQAGDGYVMADPDVRLLLRKRVRIRWLDDMTASRAVRGWDAGRELARIRADPSRVPLYDPKNRIPASALREMERDPRKNEVLRRMGLPVSARKA